MEEEEAVLGFKEEPTNQLIVEDDKSCGYKLVPWISWEEWTFVRDSLFSSSPNSISTALRRISAWRSRGCVPVVIDVTASIIEIQQKDPFFRNDISNDALHSEEMLAMLYCMAIMRLVNGVVEKMRKKNEVSIGEAADAIGIPRMLIDIRHEGSHRDLPSLRLVRLASIKALDWLKYYYWEPQKMSIPSDRTANIRKEIKSTLRELAFSIKTKQTTWSSSSVVKHKRVRQRDHLCSRNKFLFLMSGKLQSSKPAGFKKQINRMLKNLIRLYYSFSSEVISVLLEFLMKALDSVLIQSSEVSHSSNSLQAVIDEWKPAIIKLSNKEPEFLLTLLKAVLGMIETREAAKYDFGGSSSGPEQLTPEFSAEFQKTDRLSYLLEWLASNLTGLKETETKDSSRGLNMPKTAIIELLHKCLLVSSPGNNNLTSTAFVLARITGDNSLVDRLNKFAILRSSNVDISEENLTLLSPKRFLCQQEDSIHRAAEKLESFKLQLIKRNNMNRGTESEGCKNRWSKAKSWNACPIGMLPHDVRPLGRLPFLECNEDAEKGVRLLERGEKFELEKCSGKREAEYGVEALDNLSVKKMKESEVEGESNEEGEKLAKGVEGRLMIGGVLREVREEEVFAIASAVRVLV